MTWNMPRLPTRGLDPDALPAAPEPPRPDSDAYPSAVARPPWYPAVQVVGLSLPSSWTMLTVSLFWAWRVVALAARGGFDAAMLTSADLAWGLLGDLMLVFALFTWTRAITALVSPGRDPRHVASRVATRVAFLLLSLAALVRIVDVVYGAVEKVPPSAAFWADLLARPSLYLLHGGALAAVVFALATAALSKYAISCDLDAMQALADGMPRGRSLVCTHGSFVAANAAAAAVIVAALRLADPANHGRLPEVDAVQALRTAVLQMEVAAPPRAEP